MPEMFDAPPIDVLPPVIKPVPAVLGDCTAPSSLPQLAVTADATIKIQTSLVFVARSGKA